MADLSASPNIWEKTACYHLVNVKCSRGWREWHLFDRYLIINQIIWQILKVRRLQEHLYRNHHHHHSLAKRWKYAQSFRDGAGKQRSANTFNRFCLLNSIWVFILLPTFEQKYLYFLLLRFSKLSCYFSCNAFERIYRLFLFCVKRSNKTKTDRQSSPTHRLI